MIELKSGVREKSVKIYPAPWQTSDMFVVNRVRSNVDQACLPYPCLTIYTCVYMLRQQVISQPEWASGVSTVDGTVVRPLALKIFFFFLHKVVVFSKSVLVLPYVLSPLTLSLFRRELVKIN